MKHTFFIAAGIISVSILHPSHASFAPSQNYQDTPLICTNTTNNTYTTPLNTPNTHFHHIPLPKNCLSDLSIYLPQPHHTHCKNNNTIIQQETPHIFVFPTFVPPQKNTPYILQLKPSSAPYILPIPPGYTAYPIQPIQNLSSLNDHNTPTITTTTNNTATNLNTKITLRLPTQKKKTTPTTNNPFNNIPTFNINPRTKSNEHKPPRNNHQPLKFRYRKNTPPKQYVTEFFFRCNYCAKTFKRKHYLNRHKKIHENARAYRCNICNKGFNQSSGLYQHKRKHKERHKRSSTHYSRRYHKKYRYHK